MKQTEQNPLDQSYRVHWLTIGREIYAVAYDIKKTETICHVVDTLLRWTKDKDLSFTPLDGAEFGLEMRVEVADYWELLKQQRSK